MNEIMQPTLEEPTAGAEALDGIAELVQVDRALESWRDAGFDLTAAVGELIDNSIEASATNIRISTVPKFNAGVKKVEAMAFADDGNGIDPAVLANVLSLGFSTRYNQRSGLGRFGVGLKLATLSHARRVDVYTKIHGDETVWHTFLDLQMVSEGSQKNIERQAVAGYPEDYVDLMQDAHGKPLASGTLVVWSKIDRLESGGRFKNDLRQRMAELQTFIARAYRQFMDTSGLRIELNGREITLHDPLFLLENPRVTERFGEDHRGRVLENDAIKIDGYDVVVTVSVAPEALIQPRFKGDAPIAKDFHIPDNEGKISFLRQGREINYELVPRLLPEGGKKAGDRYFAIQVEFPAALDEYFQVRNVKRGVVPVDKLYQEIKTRIHRPVMAARKMIQARWDAIEEQERPIGEDHAASTQVVAKSNLTAPRGRAGAGLTVEQVSEKIETVIEELQIDVEGTLDEAQRDARAKKLRETINEFPITMVDSTWPGRELFDITHLNGKAIVKINHGHPFVRQVADPVKEMAGRSANEVDLNDAMRLLRKVDAGIELLIMAYAKAENMHPTPDSVYSELRSHWGQNSASYIRSTMNERE